MKNIFVLLFFIGIIFPNPLFSQETEKKAEAKKSREAFKDKIFLGGNVGLQFGSYTYIEVSPLVGYRISEKLSAGLGSVYQYTKYKYQPAAGADYVSFSTSVYGGRAFARYFLMENIFAHSEYELLNLEAFDVKKRIYIENILLGGGFRQMLGANSYFTLMGLWNLNENAYSPRNPIIRGGVVFGL